MTLHPEPSIVDEALTALLGSNVDPVAAGWQLRELTEKGAGQGPELVEQLASRSELLSESDPAILGGLLRALQTLLLQTGRDWVAEVDPQALSQIDFSLPEETPNRGVIRQLYGFIGSAESLHRLIESLQREPPDSWQDGAQVISPLMQHDQWDVDRFFPEALDLLQHATLASPILDLANYVMRTGRTRSHPAAQRVAMLNHLLGEVSGRLSQFEENPRAFGNDVDTVHQVLGEAVSLAVSLCDALALIGDASSIGKLHQTIELRHRRVQCEAAGALAMLGDDLGKQRLLELAADPAARLRAIRYADEIGFGDEIDDSYRTEHATAEAEMSLWLSQPAQMSVPPTSLEVLDTRRLLWPGFHDPVDVYLVQFEYNFGDRTYSNVGMTGPATFAMACDVGNLPVDDIYAIYAGWQAEHPDIFTISSDQFNDAQSRVMGTFAGHLGRLGYDSLRPELLGFFLDEQAGVFSAVRDDTECVVVTDGLETIDQVVAGRLRPMAPSDLFNMYKGRKMLRTFNSN